MKHLAMPGMANMKPGAGLPGQRPHALGPASAQPIARGLLLLGLLLIPLLWISPSHAKPKSSLKIHGFLTQATLLTDDNRFFGRDCREPNFDNRALALNGSFQPIDVLKFSAQGLYRCTGVNCENHPLLDFALVDHRFPIKRGFALGMRGGRYNIPLGLYNEIRHTTKKKPGVFLPQSVYHDSLQSDLLSTDGGAIYAKADFNGNTIDAILSIGRPRLTSPALQENLLGANLNGSLKDEPMTVARICHRTRDSGWLACANMLRTSMHFNPTVDDPLQAGRTALNRKALSLQYTTNSLRLSTEYFRSWISYRDFGPALTVHSRTWDSYYLQAELLFSKKWEILWRYDTMYHDNRDKSGTQQALISGNPKWFFFARDFTSSLRYNFSRSLLFRLEHHFVDGTAWLSRTENSTNNKGRYWNILAILASWQF